MCLDTLAITPTSASANASAVPPCETNISGTPTKGTRPTIDAMLKKDCPTISVVSPTTRKPPKASGARAAIRKARVIKATKNSTNAVVPTKPNSSPATASTESPIGSGK